MENIKLAGWPQTFERLCITEENKDRRWGTSLLQQRALCRTELHQLYFSSNVAELTITLNLTNTLDSCITNMVTPQK